MWHILSLISTILHHPDGKSPARGIARRLDSLARSIMEENKLSDVYVELNSREFRRQRAALRLLAAVVRRGLGLASEVARKFDFKLPVLSKLSGTRKKDGCRPRPATRHAFVEFAISFLEVGSPRLLRSVLQQREVYSVVLRQLGSDEEEVAISVLKALRDKVLAPDSLIPPSLRSVLFGSAALEQLVYISENSGAEAAASIAHEVLVKVCTDPSNGLMPGTNLKGNEKRLSELLKKLKATEVPYHRDLLLAIVSQRQALCAAYMNEFPYNLEPRPSTLWFSAILLAASIISSLDMSSLMKHLASCSLDAINHGIQDILKCLIPFSFTRSVINTGLLHSDLLVKHGSLRFLLELLKALDALFSAVEDNVDTPSVKQTAHVVPESSSLPGIQGHANGIRFASVVDNHSTKEKWLSMKRHAQDEVRAALPDPQVILTLLFSRSSTSLVNNTRTGLKRPGKLHHGIGSKRLKSSIEGENVDIVISGVDANLLDDSIEDWRKDQEPFSKQDLEINQPTTIAKIWGLNDVAVESDNGEYAECLFQSKLVDVLTLYMRILPIALDGSFDFFKILPSNQLSLSIDQQLSVLSLLVEHTRRSSGSRKLYKPPDLMYKHLQPLLHASLFSEDKRVRDQALILARAAMASTGAFSENITEIDAWLIFLPGYTGEKQFLELHVSQMLRNLSQVVILFLCDSVSTIGNNLYKYLDHLRKCLPKDSTPGFSPLIICILQKCLRLLKSDSGGFELYEKSVIASYVCNTLSLILQMQVDTRILAHLILSVLNENIKNLSAVNDCDKTALSVWRSLTDLQCLAHGILHEQSGIPYPNLYSISAEPSPLSLVLSKVKKIMRKHPGCTLVEIGTAFFSSVICASGQDILQNFPQLITVAHSLFGSHFQFLSFVPIHPNFFADIANMWPSIVYSGFETIESSIRNQHGATNGFSCNGTLQVTGKLVVMDISNYLESARSAFKIFLENSSFYVLFCAIFSFGSCTIDSNKTKQMLNLATLLELLKLKVVELSTGQSIVFLRVVLFWLYQRLLSYRTRICDKVDETFHMCFSIVEGLFEHILETLVSASEVEAVGVSSDTFIQELLFLIFQHPIVSQTQTNPWCCSKKPANGLVDNLEAFLTVSKENSHPMDKCILQFLRKIIDLLLDSRIGHSYPSGGQNTFPVSIMKEPVQYIKKTVLLFREKFESCVIIGNLCSLSMSFNCLKVLMCFVSPFEMLNLVHWMFYKVEDNSSSSKNLLLSSLSVCLHIADVALEMLFSYLRQPYMQPKQRLLWDLETEDFDPVILEEVYFKILNFAISYNLESVNSCLSKIVNAAYNLKSVRFQPSLLSVNAALSRMVTNSPVRIIHHCLCPVSKIKAKMLSHLVEMSSAHLSHFMQTLSDIIAQNSSLDISCVVTASPLKAELTSENLEYVLSEDDFILILPAALTFMTSKFNKSQMKGSNIFSMVPLFYSSILLSGFFDWKGYISRSIFLEQYDEFEPTTVIPHNGFCNSLLVKAIRMLHYFFRECGDSIKIKLRLKLFNSLYPCTSISNELLDSGFKEIDAYLFEDSLKLASEIVAKLALTRLLLFLPDIFENPEMLDLDGLCKDLPVIKDSDKLNAARLRFMNLLLNTLDVIVSKIPLKLDSSGTSNTAGSHYVFRFLENLILKNFIQLCRDIEGHLTQLPSVDFLVSLIKSSLFHRFEDPVTLKALRCVLITLPNSKISIVEVLELILGHSRFVPTILSRNAFATPISALTAVLLQPVPSILKGINVLPTDCSQIMNGRNIFAASSNCKHVQSATDVTKLELIRLLRVLFHLKDKGHGTVSANNLGMNSKELLSVLLSGYYASLSKTDLEIFHLMHEIQSIEGLKTISEMDYLWGDAALALRKEQRSRKLLLSTKTDDSERIDEWRKMFFRENFPLDPKLCALTALHIFPDRASRTAEASLELVLQDVSMNEAEILNQKVDVAEKYDITFILKFSIHSLMMGYIEPIEFARVGLLAVTLSSISLPDEEVRKLGYDSLGHFKSVLESCSCSKDVLQLKLLLTYLQNGIEAAWQKIPSAVAMFAAEASFILLDPLRSNFLTISRFLMHSSKVNLKAIPLFHMLFESDSIHFRADQLWILQLLYSGLNTDDDAKIYMRNGVFKSLMSFYSSALSDHESKILILGIMKKSVTLHRLARFLVQECGLLSWLSSVISVHCEWLDGQSKVTSLETLQLVLKERNFSIRMGINSSTVQKDSFSCRNSYILEMVLLSALEGHLHIDSRTSYTGTTCVSEPSYNIF